MLMQPDPIGRMMGIRSTDRSRRGWYDRESRISAFEVIDIWKFFPEVAFRNLLNIPDGTFEHYDGRIKNKVYFDMNHPFTMRDDRPFALDMEEFFTLGPQVVNFPINLTVSELIWRPNEQKVIFGDEVRTYHDPTSRPFDVQIFPLSYMVPQDAYDSQGSPVYPHTGYFRKVSPLRAEWISNSGIQRITPIQYANLSNQIIQEDEVFGGKEVLTIQGRKYFLSSIW
jgi:hypothetical protein